DDTRKSFERASTLSAQVGEPHKQVQAVYGLWGHHRMRGLHDRAIELSETVLEKSADVDDPMVRIAGYRALGSTLFTLGDFVSARDHLGQAVTLGQQVNTEKSLLSYVVDPRIASHLLLAWDLWILGYPDQAHRHVFDALRQAGEREHYFSLAMAHYVTSAVQLLRGELEDCLVHADRSFALSNEHGIKLYALYSRFGRGCALAKMGQKEEAIFEI